MADLLELLKFLAALAFFGSLVAVPAWLARRRSAGTTEEALAIADEARAELAAVVEAISAQTERIEEFLAAYQARQEERDERIATSR